MAEGAAKNNASILTFEEFRAISTRVRNAEDLKKGEGEGVGEEATAQSQSNSNSLGELLEMPQVQSFVVLMIFLDTFAALLQVLLSNETLTEAGKLSSGSGVNFNTDVTATNIPRVQVTNGDDGPPPSLLYIIHMVASSATLTNVLSSFAGFCLLFFALEILTLIVVFNMAVVKHFGYATDCLVVGGQMYLQFVGIGAEGRLLNFLRLWRLARLLASLVNIEKDAHEVTRQQLAAKDGTNRQLEGGVKRLEEELEKEKDARRAVDEMLSNYKEEVDTLNEALKIAAMDIAEVAEADDDLLLSDDEDDEGSAVDGAGGEGDGDRDENDFVDASASSYDKARNKVVLMREARRDSNASSRDPAAAAQRKAQGGHTFHVHEDGSFDVR